MATAVKNRLPFTVYRVASLPVPDEDRQYFYDTSTPGLALCVTATGARTYYLYKKINGRPCRVRIGTVDEVSLSKARDRVRTLVGRIVDGDDPQAERIAKRGEMTLGELFEHYLEHRAKPHKRTWREDEAQFKRYLTAWKNRPLSGIHKSDVQALHARIGNQNGHYAANRLRSLIHSLFAHAADLGFDKANPAKGVRKFPEQQRERFLHPDEFPRFWAALEAEPSEVCRDFFKAALLTGARRSNVLQMRWVDVNLERGTWTIPVTKSGKPQTVTLSPEAVELLRQRQAGADGGEWVFPGHRHGQHLKDPTKPWKAVLARAELADLRIHDLRRTLGSWQAASGSSLPIIGKSLGHTQPSTTAIYSRLDLEPVRASVNRATAAMMTAATAKPKGGRHGRTK